MTHYEVLGVATDAAPGEIRTAFVTLARRHHPDYFAAAAPEDRADAEQRMRRINEAWAVLSNPGRRLAYDREQGLAPDPDAFQPLDTDDAPFDEDPRDQPDTPYRTVPQREARLTRLVTFVPVVLFAAAVALLALGLFLGVPALLAVGVAALVLAAVGFVLVPLLALSRATRDEG